MSWEITRRRWIRTVQTTYILGVIPLIHSLVLFLEMAIVGRLVARFNAFYHDKPLLTMMVTNAVLGGIADTVAQSITAIRQRAVGKRGAATENGPMSYEMHDVDGKSPLSDMSHTTGLPQPFDFERLTRFMGYGFLMAPVQFTWFKQLEAWFPIVNGANAIGPAIKRVACDQIIFSPIGILCFFLFMTIAEGGGRRAVQQKLREMYLPTLKVNYYLWPAVQIINFRLMPVQFQLPFVSTIGIAWTAYLSLTNASDDVEPSDAPSARLA